MYTIHIAIRMIFLPSFWTSIISTSPQSAVSWPFLICLAIIITDVLIWYALYWHVASPKWSKLQVCNSALFFFPQILRRREYYIRFWFQQFGPALGQRSQVWLSVLRAVVSDGRNVRQGALVFAGERKRRERTYHRFRARIPSFSSSTYFFFFPRAQEIKKKNVYYTNHRCTFISN